MKPNLLYSEHPFIALRYFEWVAVQSLYAAPQSKKMYNLYEGMPFTVLADNHTELTKAVERNHRKRDAWVVTDLPKIGLDNELNTLEKVYAHIEAQLKPKLRGKALKDAKRAMGQREYQRDALGDAFVDNSKLVSAAKTACKAIAAEGGSPEAVLALVDQEASRLEEMHCEDALSDAQRATLRDTIMLPIVEELMAVGVVERKLLEGKEKHAYFLWGHIKAKCVVGGEIKLHQAVYIEWCGGDSIKHRESLDVLAKLKAVRVTWGKQGKATGEATLVKRLL